VQRSPQNNQILEVSRLGNATCMSHWRMRLEIKLAEKSAIAESEEKRSILRQNYPSPVLEMAIS
jgi:predicted transcriptional regulator